jgi:hypothetical protein
VGVKKSKGGQIAFLEKTVNLADRDGMVVPVVLTRVIYVNNQVYLGSVKVAKISP